MAHSGPLSGTTVLDLSSVGPASRATRILADYGASVIKIGAVPGRGPASLQPPFYAYSGHRFMRRVAIDVRDDGGKAAFMAVARTADVIVESFRPGVVDRLGIGYDAVRSVNPGIVYCSTSGYGQSGARSSWAGHDIDYLATGGFLATSDARADGGPPIPGATVADAAGGGMHAAMAVMAALLGRNATGEGAYLDVSATDGVLWLMSLAIDEHLATGAEPGPGHDILTGRYACYESYRARDGKWIAFGAIEPKFFVNLCEALGCPQWAQSQHDDAAQDDMRADFATAVATKDRDEWVTLLDGADTCAAPVATVAEVAADPVFAERSVFVEAKHPEAGTFRQVAPLLAGMVVPAEPVAVPDWSATDTESVLAEAGVAEDQIAAWRQEGVIA